MGRWNVSGFGIPENLQRAVIEEIVNRAGLQRKSKGTFLVNFLGNDYEAVVFKYNSFGESAFNLTLKERKRK